MIFYLRYFLYNNQVIKPTKKKIATLSTNVISNSMESIFFI